MVRQRFSRPRFYAWYYCENLKMIPSLHHFNFKRSKIPAYENNQTPHAWFSNDNTVETKGVSNV